jgi:hypothetical protein
MTSRNLGRNPDWDKDDILEIQTKRGTVIAEMHAPTGTLELFVPPQLLTTPLFDGQHVRNFEVIERDGMIIHRFILDDEEKAATAFEYTRVAMEYADRTGQ